MPPNSSRRMFIASVVALCSSQAASAAAQDRSEDAIRYRKGVFQVMRWHMEPLRAMQEGKAPADPQLLARNLFIIEQMGTLIPGAFPAGSGDGDTRARAEIWHEPEKFGQFVQRFQAEISKMRDVATQGTLNQQRQQLGAVRKSCAACHDAYRKK